jgi:hypothetical protein
MCFQIFQVSESLIYVAATYSDLMVGGDSNFATVVELIFILRLTYPAILTILAQLTLRYKADALIITQNNNRILLAVIL